MYRDINSVLKQWKNAAEHLPILLRGARQIGKTTVVEQFAKDNFAYFVNINFELEPDYASCFQSLKPTEIIKQILLKQTVPVVPGQTLLFLDEIQICPEAIVALRYFKEQMPELHVIGAGSLLEFVLNDAKFSIPVGRVQFLYMHPLSFYEYLKAKGRQNLVEHIQQATYSKPPSQVAHNELLKLIKEYLALGGMPAILNHFLQSQEQDLISCQNLQTNLLATYRNDFGKYAKLTKHKYLQEVFIKAPNLIGKQVKYSHINAETKSLDIKGAIDLLVQSGLLYRVSASSCSGLPLNALINEKKFKLLFVDVGLMNRAGKIDLHNLFTQDLSLITQGAIAEQFVGQELLAYQNPYEEPEVYFWERDKVGSQAEVDYVINLGGKIVPIEVKSGTSGRLKSLHVFMREKNVSCGIRFSTQPLNYQDNIMSIPIYMIGELKRLYAEAE
ncbi:MAG: AAA family ATPase [Gammaproteobacteria bacterium]